MESKKEIWKDVLNYEGLYKVSNYGRIKRTTKTIKKKNGVLYLIKEKEKKPYTNKNGYSYVTLYNAHYKAKTIQVHKLVAQSFISNPNKYPCINHKNENKLDNRVENLEWCSYKYNINYKNAHIKSSISHKKKILQFSLDNVFINAFDSAIDAKQKTKIDNGSISRCCYGKSKTAGGFLWRFANE